MTQIEQLHLEAIESEVYIIQEYGQDQQDDNNSIANISKAASKSAEITENIAIEFAQWIALNCFRFTPNYKGEDKTTWWDGGDLYNPKKENPISTKELFQEYLKSNSN